MSDADAKVALAEPGPAAAAAAAAAAGDTTVLVTGANGFVAAHIVRILLEQGYNVRGTVRGLNNMARFEHITSLPGADERLRLFEATFDKEGAFDEACAGADYVLHTASPYSVTVNDPEKDLVQPAVAGTESVFASIAKAGTVKRVVLTSSGAAITDEGRDDYEFDEKDWNEKSSLTRNPYYFSKAKAERRAHELSEEHKIPLSVINPLVVWGPALNTKANESHNMLVGIFKGEYPAILAFTWPIVDVRDVALAHIVAFQKGSDGRHVCCAGSRSMRQVVGTLHENLPEYSLPSTGLDNGFGNCVAKLSSYTQPGQIGQYIRTHVGKDLRFKNAHIREALDFEFRDIEQTLLETVDFLIASGHIDELRKANPDDGEIKELSGAMRAELKVSKHSCFLSTYDDSFSGTEAVDWLVKHRGYNSRSQAVRILEALSEANLFTQTNGNTQFKDGSTLYRFTAAVDAAGAQ
jgi:nucleoside-diphosphate-sugar epimerase